MILWYDSVFMVSFGGVFHYRATRLAAARVAYRLTISWSVGSVYSTYGAGYIGPFRILYRIVGPAAEDLLPAMVL